MKLIVGLGNPGKDYAEDRHNAGFMVVDRLAERLGARFNQKRARSQVAIAQVDGERVVLAKPQTYMNLSGEAVRQLMIELGVKPDGLLVVYDDLDLPLGTLRLRPHGSAGTHNGMRSVVSCLGTQAFPRLRLGIGGPREARPVRDFVLEPFSPAERERAEAMLERAAEAILCYLRHGLQETMNRFNTPARDEDKRRRMVPGGSGSTSGAAAAGPVAAEGGTGAEDD